MRAAERRTVTIGVAVSAIALLLAFVALPFQRRWSDREALISARSSQVARMRAAIAETASVSAAARRTVSEAEAWPQRVIVAPSREVAAAVLQAEVKGWADRAGVQLTRIDGDTTTTGDITATLVLVADAPGLSDLLSSAHSGRYAASIRTLDARVNPVLRGPSSLLNVTIGVSAPWKRE